jgi:hypothetical protein
MGGRSVKQSTRARRILVVSSLLILLLAGLGYADPRERLAQETGIDLDLIDVLQAEVDGIELTIVFVFINERTFDSKISGELRAALTPYVRRNAFYVNPSVEQVVAQFGFSPFEISVRQVGEASFTPGSGAWVEITSGFTAGWFEVNPSGPDQGSGSEGILILDGAIDSARPFDLMYRGQQVRFEIGTAIPPPTARPTVPSATTSHDPIEVAPLDEIGALQGILMDEGFSAQSMAALLELDPDLVRVMLLTFRGGELRMLFVRLEESVRGSMLGPDMVSALEPLIGTGAVMVWAFSAEGAAFSPWNFYVKQGGTNYVFFSSASFVELTDGFLRVERVDPGEVVAGVIRLPKSVDSTLPFSIHFGTSGVDYP